MYTKYIGSFLPQIKFLWSGVLVLLVISDIEKNCTILWKVV